MGETAVSPTFTAPAVLTVTDNLGLPSAPSEAMVLVKPYVLFLPVVSSN